MVTKLYLSMCRCFHRWILRFVSVLVCALYVPPISFLHVIPLSTYNCNVITINYLSSQPFEMASGRSGMVSLRQLSPPLSARCFLVKILHPAGKQVFSGDGTIFDPKTGGRVGQAEVPPAPFLGNEKCSSFPKNSLHPPPPPLSLIITTNAGYIYLLLYSNMI